MTNENTGIDQELEFDDAGDLKYPAHIESFETYYYLGENRSLKEAALIRFQELVPKCPPNDPKFKTNFDSYYKKIKRWAAKENWQEWIKRKEMEDSKKRRVDVTTMNACLFNAVRNYQDFIRQSLAVFAEKARLPFLLKQALEGGDAKIEEEIRKRIENGEGVEIKNFREAKEMIELDIYLSKILEQEPQFESAGESKLSEEMAEKVDKIMEWIRKKAMESCED